jgi:hypothetical protein
VGGALLGAALGGVSGSTNRYPPGATVAYRSVGSAAVRIDAPPPPTPLPGHQLMQVVCPAGVSAGGQMVVADASTGSQHMVTVPSNVFPGMAFYCQLPLPSTPAPQMAAATLVSAAPAPAASAPAAFAPAMPPPTNPAAAGAEPILVQATWVQDVAQQPSAAAAPAPMPIPAAMPAAAASAPTQANVHAHDHQAMEGWLSKLGEVNRSFKRRWFVLRDGRLRYFDKHGGTEKGAIAMRDCSTAVAHNTEDSSVEAAFTLLLASKERMYVLQASSSAEQAQWLQTLQGGIQAHAPSAAPHAIRVLPGPVITRCVGSAKHVDFEFVVMMGGGVLWRLRGRYSKLRTIHDALSQGTEAGSLLQHYRPPLPEFPAKTSFLTDDTAITSIQERLVGLHKYFQAVFSQDEGGHVLCSPLAREQLQVPPGQAAVTVDAIGKERAAARQAAVAAAEAAARQAQLQLLEDQQKAQQINLWSIGPNSAAILTYQKAMSFYLKNKFFSFGDASITGPGQHAFFRVLRQDGILWSGLLKNCQFSLGTMSGQPLIFLQEEFQWLTYRYSIYRTTSSGSQILVAQITRKVVESMLSLADQYHVKCFTGVQISCTGSWPNRFMLHQVAADGGVVVAATVTKQMLSFFSDAYSVEIAPGVDVLLCHLRDIIIQTGILN